jgi:hypothetical protein
MLRQDYIGRLIQQVAEALARAAGQIQKLRLDDAETELASAERALGVRPGMERLDVRSTAMLFGDGDKLVLLASILERRAELAAARGQQSLAARLRARARALLEHAKPNELADHAAALRARIS